MKIRKAGKEDFNRIMEIYAYARRFMAEHGNPNQRGPTNWPPEELINKDTHGDNVVMQNLLKKLGFTRCGTIYVEEDDYPRIAFEKIRD